MLAKQRHSLSFESPASPFKLVSFLGSIRENVPPTLISPPLPTLPFLSWSNSSTDWFTTLVFTFSLPANSLKNPIEF